MRKALLKLGSLLVVCAVVMVVVAVRHWEAGGDHHIRGLRIAQAWAITRTGDKNLLAAKHEEALNAYGAALRFNPAYPPALRGWLRSSMEIELAPELVAEKGKALLGLSDDLDDLRLVVETADRFEVWNLVIPASRRVTDDEVVNLRRCRALFWQEQRDGFQRFYTLTKPKMAVRYQDAYLAADGDAVALARLRKGRSIEEYRLLCWVAKQRNNLELHGEAIAKLRLVGPLRVHELVGYWSLLLGNGQTYAAHHDAAQVVATVAVKPKTVGDALTLSSALHALGQPEAAWSLLESSGAQHPNAFAVWNTAAAMAEQAGDWHRLQSVAVTMRLRRSRFEAYSWALQALAETRLGRKPQTAVGRLAECTVLLEETLPAARLLAAAGLHEKVLGVLHLHQPAFRNDAEYWFLVLVSAQAARDGDALLAATRQLYRLGPSPVSAANLATALVTTGGDMKEAAALAMSALRTLRADSGILLMLASARAASGRAGEAEAWMSLVDTTALAPEEAEIHQLVLAELAASRGNFSRAARLAASIDGTRFWPVQNDRLARLRAMEVVAK